MKVGVKFAAELCLRLSHLRYLMDVSGRYDCLGACARKRMCLHLSLSNSLNNVKLFG